MKYPDEQLARDVNEAVGRYFERHRLAIPVEQFRGAPQPVPIENATLRDYFAGQAMRFCDAAQGPGCLARRAYRYADAMLKARHAPQGESE